MIIKGLKEYVKDSNEVRVKSVCLKGSIRNTVEELREKNVSFITDTSNTMMQFMVACPEKLLQLDMLPSLHMQIFRNYVSHNKFSSYQIFKEFNRLTSNKTLEAYKFSIEIMSIADIVCDAIRELSAICHSVNSRDMMSLLTIKCQNIRSFAHNMNSEELSNQIINEFYEDKILTYIRQKKGD